MVRSPSITITRGRFGSTAAQVLEQARAAGRASRDEIAAASGLSVATVGRTATTLLGHGLLRERPDLARAGATGRPGVPVEIDRDHYLTIGARIGRRIATVAVGDLAGHVLDSTTVRRPLGAVPDLDQLSRLTAGLLGAHPGRVPLAAGLVAPWRDLGLVPTELELAWHELTGLPVRTGDHITAIAAAEFLHRRHGAAGDSTNVGQGMTLYIYARDTIGWSVAVERDGQTRVTRAASLTHFPTRSRVSCACRRPGCLAATLTTLDDVDRAQLLGQVAGVVRDMLSPDRVVLVGQAFTGVPSTLDDVVTAYDAHSSLDHAVPVSFTRFGSDIQAISACTVALGPVYDDPIAVVRAQDHACRRGA